MTTPGGAFSTGPIADHFQASKDELLACLGPRALGCLPTTPTLLSQSPQLTSECCRSSSPPEERLSSTIPGVFVRGKSPFSDPSPLVANFLPKNANPGSIAAAVLRTLLVSYPSEPVPLVVETEMMFNQANVNYVHV